MAQAQSPDFVFWQKGQVHLNWRGASVQLTAGSRCVHISGSNAGYTNFRDSVKGFGYPLHSPVSLLLPLRCVSVCHHVSTELYSLRFLSTSRVKARYFFHVTILDNCNNINTNTYFISNRKYSYIIFVAECIGVLHT